MSDLRQAKLRAALRLLVVLLMTMFLAEGAIMFGLDALRLGIPPVVEGLVDSALLVIIVLPVVWMLVVRPTVVREYETRIREITIEDASADAILVTNEQGVILSFNRAASRVFGYEACEVLGRNISLLVPADGRDAHARGFQAFVAGDLDSTNPLMREVTAQRRDGLRVPVELTIGVAEAQGKRKFVAVVRDISARKLLEAERDKALLELSNKVEALESATRLYVTASKRFENLFLGLPVACVTFDQEGIVQEVNDEFERLYGYAGHEVVFKPMWGTIRHSGDEAETRETIERLFSGEAVRNVERVDLTAENEDLPVLVSMLSLVDSEGVVCGGIRVSMDIREQKRLEEATARQLQEIAETNRALRAKERELESLNDQLKALATQDGMTGLTNYRAFREAMRTTRALCERQGAPVSLILLDVDHFKPFNDRFGHQAGDSVLAAVAKILSEHSRAGDLVARYGGEEFVVLLPGTEMQGAMAIAERYRCAIEAAAWDSAPVTASFGVATALTTDLPDELLIEHADQAMYASKADGRNRCRPFVPDEVPRAA